MTQTRKTTRHSCVFIIKNKTIYKLKNTVEMQYHKECLYNRKFTLE